MWYDKRRQTIESSTFSSRLISMNISIEAIEHLQFKLKIFGIPLESMKAMQICCDNEAVVKNATRTKSMLNKKHSAIVYHSA